MRGSSIQWCDDTVNPVMGCAGCELWQPDTDPPVRRCYAGALHETRGRTQSGYAPVFERPEVFAGRMAKEAREPPLLGALRPEKPWLNGLPRLVFISDMGDTLSPQIGFEYLETEVVDVVSSARGRHHRWLWLTKRPHRMAEFSSWLRDRGRSWPANLWAGTSITNSATYQRIADLLKVGGLTTRRFLSVEPQVTSVDLRKWLHKLDWVIQGGESGKDARPFLLEWALHLKRQCAEARVPYFLKQLGRQPVHRGQPLALADGHGGDWAEWPRGLGLREVPREDDPLRRARGRARRSRWQERAPRRPPRG